MSRTLAARLVDAIALQPDLEGILEDPKQAALFERLQDEHRGCTRARAADRIVVLERKLAAAGPEIADLVTQLSDAYVAEEMSARGAAFEVGVELGRRFRWAPGAGGTRA